MLMRTILVLCVFCLASCGVPYFYEGEIAILVSDNVSVKRHQTDLGDCDAGSGGLPTVYLISTPTYNLHVAHGNRYWPEFFLAAESKEHEPLEIIGMETEPVRAPWGSHPRLEESRGLKLSHHTARLDRIEGSSIKVAILDSSWSILGVEELEYETKKVNCLTWDTL